MWKHLYRWAVPGLLLCLAPSCNLLQTQAKSSALPAEVEEPLRAMGDHLAQAESLYFVAQTSSDELLEAGPMVEFSGESRVTIQRPDKLRAEIRGDLANRDVFYDSQTLGVIDHDLQAYALVPLPDHVRDLDGMLDYLITEHQVEVPLIDFLFSDPYEGLVANIERAHRVGIAEIEDVPCTHLAFQQAGIDWQIWIENEGQALPRHFVITHRQLAGQPEYSATFTEWDLDPTIEAGAFTFPVPEGMREIELQDLLAGNAGEQAGDEE